MSAGPQQAHLSAGSGQVGRQKVEPCRRPAPGSIKPSDVLRRKTGVLAYLRINSYHVQALDGVLMAEAMALKLGLGRLKHRPRGLHPVDIEEPTLEERHHGRPCGASARLSSNQEHEHLVSWRCDSRCAGKRPTQYLRRAICERSRELWHLRPFPPHP